MDNNECDCLIAILNNYGWSDANRLHLSDYKKKLDDASKISQLAVNNGFRMKGLLPRDYLDRRKGMAMVFNYCPFCGKRINWRRIKSILVKIKE